MKPKFFIVLILAVIVAITSSSCSKTEVDPDDYSTSLLSGNYEKDGIWKLYVSVDGETPESYGSVRFDSKDLEFGNFRFVNVIPGVKNANFSNIPLTETEQGFSFSIDYSSTDSSYHISGLIILGQMTVEITTVNAES